MKPSKRNTLVGPQIREGIKKRGSNKVAASIVAVSFVGALQTATQYFAYRLHYHPALGWNVGHVYPTWDIFSWLVRWQGHFQYSFQMAGAIGMSVAAGGVLTAAIAKMCDGKKPEGHEYLHGSARWANLEDIERSSLMPKNDGKSSSVYVGAWKDEQGNTRYLRHAGPEHVLTFAPTRSGKGVGLVIPTMLIWRDSVVITDIKGELWALTSGWRQKYAGNKVIKWEPASENSARWNPLQEVRKGTSYETADVQNIATLIVDPDGKGLKDHWDRTAFSTITGMILHAIYNEGTEKGRTASLGEVDRMLADPEQPGKKLWENMRDATYYIDPKTGKEGPHPVVLRTALDMLETPEEELGSKISTIKSHLALYRDDVILKNTETCDYRIKDLMHRDEPVSLYIVTQPADKSRLNPLVKLKLNMIMRILTAEMDFENGQPKANYKHRLLMMLDEFPALGKMEILQESLAFCAGYGIKAYLITQDLNQLTAIYGKDESITSNCHVQNAYPPNRQETAEHLSKLCGTTTIVKESISESGKGFNKSISRSFQETARPLLTPDEALRMPGPKKNAKGQIEEGGDMVIFVAGFPAVYGKQILYFKDETFLARAAVPAPEKSDVFEKKETSDQIIRKSAEETDKKQEKATNSPQEPQKPADTPQKTEPQQKDDPLKNPDIVPEGIFKKKLKKKLSWRVWLRQSFEKTSQTIRQKLKGNSA